MAAQKTGRPYIRWVVPVIEGVGRMPTQVKMKPEPLTGTTTAKTHPSTIPPGVPVGFGTAGCNRGRKFTKRMGDAGHIDWLQSIFCYDFNQETIETINKMAREQRGSPGPSVLVPSFVRKPQGFLRNPRAFEDYYGLINRDLDKMIA